MIDFQDIVETNRMIKEQNLDVRTITMVSVCVTVPIPIWDAFCRKIYEKNYPTAEHLVKVGADIEAEYGVHHQQTRIGDAHRHCGGSLPHRQLCRGSGGA